MGHREVVLLFLLEKSGTIEDSWMKKKFLVAFE